MKKSLTIFKYDFLQFFSNIYGYIFIAIFTIIYAIAFSLKLFISNTFNLKLFFDIVHLLFLVYIPILSTNLFSKEKQNYTLETLLVMPIKKRDIVIGKFLFCLSIIILSLLPSIIHLITINSLSNNVDSGVIFCGYISLLLTGEMYCSICIFASIIISSQITSTILSFIIILFFFLLDQILVYMPLFLTPFMQYMSIIWQNNNLIKGILDTRVIIYFISAIFIFLYTSIYIFENKENY
jgi:ABC-2 type transport system permease protein